jgi:hypothetical protein
MAKMSKLEAGFRKSIRNRGEDIGYPLNPGPSYDKAPADQYTDKAQERAIRRHEARDVYAKQNELGQRRDQRAFSRTQQMENEFYAGIDPRRRQELADGGMIREDQNAMANLSPVAAHYEYPQAGYYQSPYIDGAVRGTNPSLDDNSDSMARKLNPVNKYPWG